ncbi:MAG: hydantoinase/oxoprolinase family protein [Actinobacteria bacterium]|nr:hydantoinase/oxoprolinase family protein [Actinomycetota bacterium]
MSKYVIGIDVGGTGTDCAVLADDGVLTVGKSFSTPPDFTDGMLNSLGIAAEKLGLSTEQLLAETEVFLHSTTVGENAIGDGDLSKAALLLTSGFDETLVMTRGAYGRWTGLTHDQLIDMISTTKPEPLVPLSLTTGIRERTDSAGNVLLEPETDQLAALVAGLDEDVEAVGLCFLWSFLNPANERAVAAAVRAARPDLYVTASSEISSTIGEYERASTVALNVKLGPLVAGYLERLRDALAERGFEGSTLLMQAHGGAVSLADAQRTPVSLLESGPVGGLVGAQALAEQVGDLDVIAADVGGTTFKVSVISDGRVGYQRDPAVLRYHYVLPKLDIHSESFAGGSIVWLEPPFNSPRIGPRSAGADPGPVCFGIGGTEATVTDVDVLLGYLNADFYMEGRGKLDVEAARAAFEEQIASPLGLEVTDAASAVYRLVNSQIYDALHKLTVESGIDARDYVLYSYGGTAGMHLPAVAQELGVRSVLIPGAAGVQGAFGLVCTDVVHDELLTKPMVAPADAGAVEAVFAELAEGVLARLEAEGFDRGEVTVERSVDLRYTKQLNLVTTPFEVEGAVGEEDLGRLIGDYETLYERLYGPGTAFREAGVELVNFRVRATARLSRPDLVAAELEGPDPSAAFVEEREAYFVVGDAVQTAKGYAVTKLRPGNVVEGPAILWSPITTIVANPGQRVRVDEHRNLIVTWEPA